MELLDCGPQGRGSRTAPLGETRGGPDRTRCIGGAGRQVAPILMQLRDTDSGARSEASDRLPERRPILVILLV